MEDANQVDLNTAIEKNVDPNLQSIAKNIVTNQPANVLHYQGILPRGAANVIDQLIIALPIYFLAHSFPGSSQDPNNDPVLGFAGLALLIYFTVAESLYGQTIGKKLLKLKVVNTDGTKCGLKGGIIRNLGRILDLLLGSYLLGMILIILTPKKQRIGDLLAKTVVISTD